MSRRASLPGADELFRVTGPGEAPRTAPESAPAAVEPLAAVPDGVEPEPAGAGTATAVAERPRVLVNRRAPRGGQSRSSGRERHEEKITVYVSSEELFDLEHARLLLRGEHGLAVDRGRIVREALAVVLADLEAKGGSSILVRRLQEG
ncbi:MAG TPA: cobyrinic acid a,c-diamide synthase [Mycobacteriales bacterium]|nr:cobyrinic acid a,c-diamide synthase [Mycobacteriales bacterium]